MFYLTVLTRFLHINAIINISEYTFWDLDSFSQNCKKKNSITLFVLLINYYYYYFNLVVETSFPAFERYF